MSADNKNFLNFVKIIAGLPGSHAYVNKWIMVHFQPRTHIQWLIRDTTTIRLLK